MCHRGRNVALEIFNLNLSYNSAPIFREGTENNLQGILYGGKFCVFVPSFKELNRIQT